MYTHNHTHPLHVQTFTQKRRWCTVFELCVYIRVCMYVCVCLSCVCTCLRLLLVSHFSCKLAVCVCVYMCASAVSVTLCL